MIVFLCLQSCCAYESFAAEFVKLFLLTEFYRIMVLVFVHMLFTASLLDSKNLLKWQIMKQSLSLFAQEAWQCRGKGKRCIVFPITLENAGNVVSAGLGAVSCISSQCTKAACVHFCHWFSYAQLPENWKVVIENER